MAVRLIAGGMLSRSDLGRPTSRKDEGPVSTAQRWPSKKTVRMGDEGKAVGCVPPTALLFMHNIGRAVHIDWDQRA
jgi:hypothetical protein